jgi:hypothetical protein
MKYDVAPGARVVDREADDPSLAVVLEREDVPAEEYTIAALDGDTVADVNPEYPGEAAVATVVFVEELAAYLERWDEYTPAVLQKHVNSAGLRTYSYPVPRLQLAGEADREGSPPGGEA